MSTTSTETSSDKIISELHRIREGIAESFGGDLRKYTDDARSRQQTSGHPIWSGGRAQAPKPPLRSPDSGAR